MPVRIKETVVERATQIVVVCDIRLGLADDVLLLGFAEDRRQLGIDRTASQIDAAEV